jgi:mRNA-degrading endonuclease YafQ of YafQ-DinJ toxin-antitoxin module
MSGAKMAHTAPQLHRRATCVRSQHLYKRGLRNLYDVLVREVPASAYSYVFEAQAQMLDQLFVSPRLRSELAGVREAHINADWRPPSMATVRAAGATTTLR